MGLACSTSGKPAAPQPDASPGAAVTACQIQGYVSEVDGGLCPEGTCAVGAFDTNGGLLPCCTSVVSGPGMCLGSSDGATEGDGETGPSDGSPDGG
jgi:hypothetical protein